MRRSLGGESAKVYRLHPCEKALAFVAAALLIFQPWALGGMYLWTQYIAGAIALIAFIVALIPRHYTDEHHAGPELKLVMWPKLLRFPFFWLGLLYIAFVIIQIFNPAWQYVSVGKGWFLQKIDYITWLPHGIADAPAIKMNGWRTLLIHGTLWLLVCALWVGITRRKTIRVLLTTLALNGTLIALAVLLQRLTDSKKMFWILDPPAHYFVGSFIYKNHGGAFFILILGTLLGLAWWHTAHAERRLEKSHPGMVLVLLGTIVMVALTFTYARATTALGAGLLLLVAAAYGIRLAFKKSGGPPKLVTAILAVAGAGFIGLCIASFNVDSVWKRFDRLNDQDEFSSITTRQLAIRATWDMAQSGLVTGHGAGGFRYLFPFYQQAYPDIWRVRHWNKQAQEYRYGRRLYWEHAHNDYAELIAENGLIGVGMLLTLLAFIGAAIRAAWVFSNPPLLILLGGPALVAISAAVDFPFHNPAVLVTTGVITALTLRWGMLARS
jgi:O-antigen ligase